MFRTFIFICMTMAAGNAYAVMYKCTDDQGNVSFKDLPCVNEEEQDWKKETNSEADARRYREFQSRQQSEKQISEGQWKEIDLPAHVQQGIMSYLDQVLKDPDSLKDMKWLGTQTDGKNYRTMVFFRAKNSWGAYGISQYIFKSSQTGVVTNSSKIE